MRRSSFIRPEAGAVLRRWREALAGLAIALLGLYWIFGTSPGLLMWVGYLTLAIGGLLSFAGLQKGRFRHGGGGPGLVQIVERRIAYFGPLDGGIVDLDALTSLTYDPTQKPAHWVLTHQGGAPLHIPVTAEGADALFDAFASLPGLAPGRLAAVSQSADTLPVHLWHKATPAARIARLH
ncbi:hypothetical protein [Marivita sp. GX14005]|uniref:hypothetical protein n=1 Tax=Marivita sp. GX14005 TaxID=2942276 RepID=UPI002018879E|nr:hypothetical protein [Marivita sp. GX14005]MCL3881856.1 hypothetical protein [Marivita sp. GX14005]